MIGCALKKNGAESIHDRWFNQNLKDKCVINTVGCTS